MTRRSLLAILAGAPIAKHLDCPYPTCLTHGKGGTWVSEGERLYLKIDAKIFNPNVGDAFLLSSDD